jgi:hypothetical protein
MSRLLLLLLHHSTKLTLIIRLLLEIGLDVGYNRLGSDYVCIYVCMYALV